MSTILHVGLMKTGSTALQGRFFPLLQDTAYVSHGTHELFKPLCWSLLFSDDDAFFPGTMREYFRDIQGEQPTLLFSQEALTWCHHGGRSARRLHQVVDDATIVIVVRSQRTILRSMYNQYLQHGGTESIRGWLNGVHFEPTLLRYDEVVADYQELYGRGRVVVLLYEQLVADPEAFCREFCERTGTRLPAGQVVDLGSANQSLARPSLWALRRVNQAERAIGKGGFNPLFPNLWPRGKDRHSRFWHRSFKYIRAADARLPGGAVRRAGAGESRAMEQLAVTCAKSNRRLEELTGVSLEAYGYPLP